jgi:hypothetical protein
VLKNDTSFRNLLSKVLYELWPKDERGNPTLPRQTSAGKVLEFQSKVDEISSAIPLDWTRLSSWFTDLAANWVSLTDPAQAPKAPPDTWQTLVDQVEAQIKKEDAANPPTNDAQTDESVLSSLVEIYKTMANERQQAAAEAAAISHINAVAEAKLAANAKIVEDAKVAEDATVANYSEATTAKTK